MLRIDETFRDEVKAARNWRDKHLMHWKAMKERFTGPAYRHENYIEGADIENIVGQYVSLVLPRVAYDYPRVHVIADDPSQDRRGRALELMLNQWSKRSALRPTLQELATDMCLLWGVGLVTPEPVKHLRRIDMGGAGLMPRVYRIAPENFFVDPSAESHREARYFGHEYPIDIEDLVAMAEDPENRLDLAVVKELKSSYDTYRDKFRTSPKDLPEREQTTMMEVWCPELEIEGAEEGVHHGGLLKFAMSAENDIVMVGEPIPYYGPACGPYTMIGAYEVPSDVYPLSPMVMALPLIEEANDHAKTMSYSAGAYRRLIAVDSRGTKMAQDIASTPDLFVVPAENLDRDRVVPMEIGGVTEQQMAYQNIMAARLDRLTGMSEVIRGSVTGDATATEISTASASSGLRLSYIQRQFAEAVNSLIYKAAWYVINDSTELPMGREAVEEGMPARMPGTELGVDLAEMTLDVQAYSMERTSEALQQRRAVELMQIIGNVGQQATQMPFIDWERMMSVVGDALNMPDMADILNVDELKRMTEQAQQAQQQQAAMQQEQAAANIAQKQAAARSRMQTGSADVASEQQAVQRANRGSGGF